MRQRRNRTRTDRARRRGFIALALSASVASHALAPASAAAQPPLLPAVPMREHLPWRTLETRHFAFHYPAEMEGWTRAMAERADAQHDAVRRLVGWAPRKRVHVVVEDPFNVPNGAAFPFLDAPGIFVWPVPPGPRSSVGDGRSWPELLLVHEFAHVAQLARPSRNRWRRLLTIFPGSLGPLPLRTPRWVWEGYATFVEGQITGSGRPYGAWRPAYLRQWALEGRLPTYASVSGSEGFAGGSFAYMAGSAYFEWLVAQRGDSALPHLWRRMTARTVRSFDEAFAGVFPGSPAELYSRWLAQTTAEAVAAERRLRDAGLVEGTVVQRLAGGTGDPAASPDGRLVALALRPPNAPSRLVVWRTAPDPPDTARERRARRALERDPEDVAAVQFFPPPKRAAATLHARDGRGFYDPRFLPDGCTLLVVHDEPLSDGVLRPDLYAWDLRRRRLRRVTRGASVRQPDPAPDGRSALATRCAAGACGVVRVDLASGAVSTLLAGTPEVTYDRPRWAPDGRRFAVSEQRAGRWRTLVGDANDPAAARAVGPDGGADRYDAAWLGTDTLVRVSERGGVPNLERVALSTGEAATLTRTTGATLAPEPIPGARAAWFLSLRSHGLDVRRLPLDSARALDVVAIDAPGATLGAARVDTSRRADVASGAGSGAASAAVRVREPFAAPVPPPEPLGAARSYGAGPQRILLLPVVEVASDGESAIGVVSGGDPVGRLAWTLQGAASSDRTTWRGGALTGVWRGTRPALGAQAFVASHAVRESLVGGAAPALDAAYQGGLIAFTHDAAYPGGAWRVRGGASWGVLSLEDGERTDRALGFLDYFVRFRRGRGKREIGIDVLAHVTRGRTADSTYTRAVTGYGAWLRNGDLGLRFDHVRAQVNSGAPAYERPLVGGPASPLIDASLLSQRLAFPLMPTGAVSGRVVETARLSLTGPISPFAWWARDPDAGVPWRRVVGVEARLATAPIPIARVPGVSALAGVAYSFDDPLRDRTRGYFGATITP